MSRSIRPTPAPSTSRQRDAQVSSTLAVALQAGVVLVTLVMGLAFPGTLWMIAFLQACGAVGLLVWWRPQRYTALVLAVPFVSIALTFGLQAISNTVAYGCSDRVLEAFEEMPPPKGASFEMFVGGETHDCMAEIREPIVGAEVFAHYRRELDRHGWQVTQDERGFLRAERDGMYINLYGAEGHVYFILEEL